MEPRDVTVEVLDRDLQRVAQVLPRYWTDGKFSALHRGVGGWEMSLPAELEAAQLLAQPGAGILVTGAGRQLFAGPTDSPSLDADQDDPTGTIKFAGPDYGCIIGDALAWPTPTSGAVAAQTSAYDVRSGPAETVIRGLIDANIGPSAPPSRRGRLQQLLTLEPDLGRGGPVQISSRFDNLLVQAATAARVGGIGFRVVVVDQRLVLRFYEPQDLSSTIRLDLFNRRLTSYKHALAAPTVTDAIVGGQGEGTARVFLERRSAASAADEAAWGRRIETFVDQRQTDAVDELTSAGDDALAEGAATERTELSPTDDEEMAYGRDWFVGDFISAVIGTQERPRIVTQAGVGLTSDGVRIAAIVGDLDVDGLRELARLRRRVRHLETRI